MAEFLLAIFIVLSLGIFQILILSAVTNYKIKDNLMKYMLFTLVILLAIAAYMFDFQANSNNDLKRFVQEFEAIKNNRADLFQIMSKNHPFEFLYYIIAFLMSFVTDYHWFPVLCVLFEYSVFVYILSRESKHFDNQALGIIICIIYKIALIPPYMSISASRNTIAYALFSLGIYRLFKEDGNDIKKKLVSILMLIGGGLIHTSVFLSVIVLLLAFLIRNRQKLLPLILLWGGLYSIVIGFFSGMEGEFAEFASRKGNNYLAEVNNTNIARMKATLPWMIVFFVVCLIFLFLRKKKLSKCSIFILAQIAVAIGSAFIPTLFLRMSYPVSILFPIVFAELQDVRKEKLFRQQIVFPIIIMISTIMLFINTRYGWLRELVWEITGRIK